MTDYIIPTRDEADFNKSDEQETRAICMAMMQVFRTISPHLHSTVIASFLITYLMNNSENPVAAWGNLTKEITAGIAKAVTLRDTKGSA